MSLVRLWCCRTERRGQSIKVFLDELHGLRISIAGHKGRWPILILKIFVKAHEGAWNSEFVMQLARGCGL